MTVPRSDEASPGYQIFTLALCVYALGVMVAQSVKTLRPETVAILDYVDYAVCAVFLFDFFKSLYQSKNRWRYLATWGWLDLLSSIPMLDIGRWGCRLGVAVCCCVPRSSPVRDCCLACGPRFSVRCVCSVDLPISRQ